MANVFQIAPINPIRFNTEFVDWYDFEHSKEKCYYQKFQNSDTTIFQVLSDFPNFTVTLKDYETNSSVANLNYEELPVNFSGETFKAYNVTVPFLGLPEGYYYIQVTYTDENNVVNDIFSNPIHVAPLHKDTLLITYHNSENNFSVVFTDDTIFNLRVEGTIQDFQPEADDQIYFDQERNSTKLSSIPYRVFTLYIGNASGVPDWMGDKVNRAMSTDSIKIDGKDFEKNEGAEWEVERLEEYPFAGYTIDIVPTENLFMQRLILEDEEGTGRKVLYRKAANYFNQGGDFNVSNVFKNYTLLDYITIYRNSGNPYTLNVGVSPGGSEIGSFLIIDPAHTQTIRWAFDAPTVVYLSGLNGNNDISLVYEQLDEEGGGGGSGVPNPYPAIGIGAVVIYEGTDEQFAVDFDASTGLGNIGTQWEGYAICDGRNGTADRGGMFPIGYKANSIEYAQPGATGGEATHTLTEAELPTVNLTWKFERGQRNDVFNGRDGIIYSSDPSGKNNAPIDRNPIQPFGGGEAHNNIPPYIVSIFVKKIA